ncbi:hypothetical protein AB1Y20_002539 [Prymnesium parvum]|uniref:Uncharacterized protein n=1 Tax=Prymnesium parvum TaxID=97485 RepID=A0AB34JBY6_PRYPA
MGKGPHGAGGRSPAPAAQRASPRRCRAPAVCSGMRWGHAGAFPNTLEGYSTYFDRPSSRPPPRLRAR